MGARAHHCLFAGGQSGGHARCARLAPPTDPAGSAFDEGAQLARAVGPAQLLERLRLDLADALARDAEGLAHFLERVLARAAEPEAHAQDALLARGEIGERLGHELAEFAPRRPPDG